MAFGDVSDTNWSRGEPDHRAGPESTQTFKDVSAWSQKVLLFPFFVDFLHNIYMKRKTKTEPCIACTLRRMCEHCSRIWILLHWLQHCYDMGHRSDLCIKFICNLHMYFVLLSVCKCTETSEQLWETFDPESHFAKRSNFSDKRSLHIKLQQHLYIIYLHSVCLGCFQSPADNKCNLHCIIMT